MLRVPLYQLLTKWLKVFIFTMTLVYPIFQGSYVFAQPDPGGVSTNISLWVRADAGTSCTTDGCNFANNNSWQDQTSPFNHGDPPNGTNTETLELNEMNFNPGVELQGNGYFDFSQDITGNFTIFVIFRTTDTRSNGDWWDTASLLNCEQGGGQNDWGLCMDNGRLLWGHNADNRILQTATVGEYNNDVPHLVNANRSPFGPVAMQINGGTVTPIGTPGQGLTYTILTATGGVTGTFDDADLAVWDGG